MVVISLAREDEVVRASAPRDNATVPSDCHPRDLLAPKWYHRENSILHVLHGQVKRLLVKGVELPNFSGEDKTEDKSVHI